MVRSIYSKIPLVSKVMFLTLIIFCIIDFVYVIRFEENDDIVMLLMASGKYSGEFESHLVFINFIYGKFLNYLYAYAPNIEWYPILFIIFNIVSTTIIATLIIKSKNNKITKVIFLVFLAAIFLQLNIHLQFTKTAAILLLSGLMLFYTAKTFKSYLVAVVLLVIGSLIRFEVAGLVLLLVLPFFIVNLFNKNKKLISGLNIGLVVSLLLIVFFKELDNRYYKVDANWEFYKTYNKVRGKINDNPNAGKLVVYPKGITNNDYVALHSFFIDPSIFNIDNLNQIVKLESENNSFNFINIQKLYIRYLIWFLPLSFLYIVLMVSKIKPYSKLKITSLFLSLILILSFIALNGLVKYRVFISSVSVFVLFIPLIVNFNFTKKIIIKLSAITILFLILVMTYKSFYILLCQKDDNMRIQQQDYIVSEYLKNDKNKLMVFGADYNMELRNALNFSDLNSFSKQLYFNGWMTSIPIHSPEFNSFKDFTNHFAIFVSKKNSNKLIQIVKNNYIDHNRGDIEANIVLESKSSEIIEFNLVVE